MNQKSYIIRDEDLRKRAINFLLSLPLNSPWEFTVKPYIKKRSNEQHAYFWVCCSHVAKVLTEAGHTCSADEIHDLVLMHVYGTRRSELRPELIYPARTLTKPRTLNKLEFSDLIEQFMEYAASKGILLPEASYDA